MAYNIKKFLDSQGIEHFTQLLNNYPNNEILSTVIDAIQDELDTKASLDSPIFTGTPIAPTPINTDNSTKIATTAFVQSIVNDNNNVEQYSNLTNFPQTGETNKIYIDTSNNLLYRWTGTKYMLVGERYDNVPPQKNGTMDSLVYNGDKYKWNYSVHGIDTGAGLVGGPIGYEAGDGHTPSPITGIIKAKLRSETPLTNDSVAATETQDRIYPVTLDKSGYLSVNVPWEQSTLVFDAAPTENSLNPVQSGGVYTAIRNAVDPISNVVTEIPLSIEASSWSSSSPYTYTWTDSRVLSDSSVEVDILNTSADTTAEYLDYAKTSGGGGIVFTANKKPTASISVIITITNAQAHAGSSIDADTVATDTISGAENVDEALTKLNEGMEKIKSDIGIVEDTDTAVHTISEGQYVIWKGVLYTAKTAIPSGTALSASNLTAVGAGGIANVIGDALVPVEITSLVTFNESEYASNQTHFYVIGKLLVISYMGSITTHAQNDELLILPSGYVPLTNVVAPAVINNGAYGNVVVQTNGKIRVNQVSDSTVSGRLYFSVVVILK